MSTAALPGSTAPARWRGLLRRFVLLGGSTAFALLLAELLLRLVAPAYVLLGATFYAPDPALGFTLAPGFTGELVGVGEFRTHVRTERHGLRGAEPAANAAHPRLLGLGDSFAFGWGVEEDETYLARVAARLGGTPLNAGVPGFSPCQAVARGLRLTDELAPDALLLTLFPGNDEVDELHPPGDFTVVGGELADGPPRGFAPGFRKWLNASSHLVRTLRHSPVLQAPARKLGFRESSRERMLRTLMTAYREPVPAEIAGADGKLQGCLERLRRFGEEKRLPVLVVLLPSDRELVAERFAQGVALLGEPSQRFDASAPRRRLAALTTAAGLPLLDVTPALQAAAARGETLFYRFDGHLTRAGQAVVGEEIRPALAELLGASAAAR